MRRKQSKGVLFAVTLTTLLGACEKYELSRQYPESIVLMATNDLDVARPDEVMSVQIGELRKKDSHFNAEAFLVLGASKELTSQAVDVNRDGSMDEILILADFEASQQKTFTIRYAKTGEIKRIYPKRTQAELSHKSGGHFEKRKYMGGTFQNTEFVRVPPEHTDHSFFFRYEGPGWESDRVGYRFYLDWRNAIDVFGKKVPDMILQDVGQDGFDSYHEMAAWGMDILKVGNSLGIGSIGTMRDGKVRRVAQTESVTCAITQNGAVRSAIQTRYFGWTTGDAKHNLISDLSIDAGSRLTRHVVRTDPATENICTGLVKHEAAHRLPPGAPEPGWVYLATYGAQSLAGDNLGLAIIYRSEDLLELTEDDLSYVAVLRSGAGPVSYYFLAAWEQEPNGITDKQGFESYLNGVVARLTRPIRITFN